MPAYRLYLESNLTQRFEPAIELDMPDDKCALAWADEFRMKRSAELWCGSRLVHEWDASPQ
jgi:hypothetical protein